MFTHASEPKKTWFDTSKDELSKFPDIDSSKIWNPQKHIEVVDALENMITSTNREVRSKRIVVSKDRNQLFALFAINDEIDEIYTLLIGLQNCTGKKISRVLYCGISDIQSGDILINKRIGEACKNTQNGDEKYLRQLGLTAIKLPTMKLAEKECIQQLQNIEISEEKANSIILEAIERKIIPERLIHDFIRIWRSDSKEHNNALDLLQTFMKVFTFLVPNKGNDIAEVMIQIQHLFDDKFQAEFEG